MKGDGEHKEEGGRWPVKRSKSPHAGYYSLTWLDNDVRRGSETDPPSGKDPGPLTPLRQGETGGGLHPWWYSILPFFPPTHLVDPPGPETGTPVGTMVWFGGLPHVHPP